MTLSLFPSVIYYSSIFLTEICFSIFLPVPSYLILIDAPDLWSWILSPVPLFLLLKDAADFFIAIHFIVFFAILFFFHVFDWYVVISPFTIFLDFVIFFQFSSLLFLLAFDLNLEYTSKSWYRFVISLFLLILYDGVNLSLSRDLESKSYNVVPFFFFVLFFKDLRFLALYFLMRWLLKSRILLVWKGCHIFL